MKQNLQKLLGCIFVLFCTVGLASAQSKDALNKEVNSYPNRPIRIINPLATGGAVDTMARMLAPTLQEILGQTVVIESKPERGVRLELILLPNQHLMDIPF